MASTHLEESRSDELAPEEVLGLERKPDAEEARRNDQRTRTIYRLVLVQNEEDQGLARCRNISDGGMALDLNMQIAVQDRIEISLSPSFSVGAEVVWADGKRCGIKFDRKVDCTELLGQSAAETRANGARAPRLTANLPARVHLYGKSWQTEVRDISQRGMKLTNNGALLPGAKVTVSLSCGKKVEGVVRWTSEDTAGLFLLEPFSVDELGSIRTLSR